MKGKGDGGGMVVWSRGEGPTGTGHGGLVGGRYGHYGDTFILIFCLSPFLPLSPLPLVMNGSERGRQLEKLLLSGRTPSFSSILAPHTSLVRVDEDGGEVVFDLVVGKEITNINGFLHGGAAATAVDVLSTIALVALAPEKTTTGGVSIEIHTQYTGAAPKGATITVTASARSVGSRIAFLDVDARDAVSGKSYFTGQHIKFIGSNPKIKSKL